MLARLREVFKIVVILIAEPLALAWKARIFCGGSGALALRRQREAWIMAGITTFFKRKLS
jgi:hypothetical protein